MVNLGGYLAMARERCGFRCARCQGGAHIDDEVLKSLVAERADLLEWAEVQGPAIPVKPTLSMMIYLI